MFSRDEGAGVKDSRSWGYSTLTSSHQWLLILPFYLHFTEAQFNLLIGVSDCNSAWRVIEFIMLRVASLGGGIKGQ